MSEPDKCQICGLALSILNKRRRCGKHLDTPA